MRPTIGRFFSDASHAPPKKLTGIVGRYASAMYTAASKAKKLPVVESELTAIMNMMKTNKDFGAFMTNPTVARSAKTQQLGEILDEKTFSFMTRNLFLTMSANGRIGDIEKVVSAYTELMEASRGAIKVVVTSADALPKKKLDTVKSAVMDMVGKGTEVSIEVKTDPSILGGLQVLVGDRFMDLSVNSRVQELTSALESAEA